MNKFRDSEDTENIQWFQRHKGDYYTRANDAISYQVSS